MWIVGTSGIWFLTIQDITTGFFWLGFLVGDGSYFPLLSNTVNAVLTLVAWSHFVDDVTYYRQ